MDNQAEIKFMNIKEASKLLGVSPLTLRNWDNKGKLTAYRHPINNYRVYKLNELKDFIDTIKKLTKTKKISIKFIEEGEENFESLV